MLVIWCSLASPHGPIDGALLPILIDKWWDQRYVGYGYRNGSRVMFEIQMVYASNINIHCNRLRYKNTIIQGIHSWIIADIVLIGYYFTGKLAPPWCL